MEDVNVVIGLRDDEETCVTTVIVSEEDALRIRDLRPSTRSGPQIDLPSVDGYARLEGDTLKLIYARKGSQPTISVLFIDRAPCDSLQKGCRMIATTCAVDSCFFRSDPNIAVSSSQGRHCGDGYG